MSAHHSTVNQSRLLVTRLRDKDDVDVGSGEAVDTIINHVLAVDPSLKKGAVLDVGSGFGGKTDYLHRAGFTHVQGVDLDETAVAYAQAKYPHLHFQVGNALHVDQMYAPQSFSFLHVFHVSYAIQEKALLLQRLATIAKPGGILVLFDYAEGKTPFADATQDLAGKPMYPIQVPHIQKDLKAAGWKVMEITDITPLFVTVYREAVNKLAAQLPVLRKEFSAQAIQRVQDTFSVLATRLEKGDLGGVIIYAQWETPPSFPE